MSGKKRLVALITALAVCFVMLFSVALLATEANHHCCGEKCPVCAQIQFLNGIIKSFGTALCAVYLIFFAVLGFAGAVSALPSYSPVFSLIKLKVKLTD